MQAGLERFLQGKSSIDFGGILGIRSSLESIN